ncbi:hypothetical protein Scep_004796 [Stephania cephalantha]|uniref:Uncharacterized protein n=1 Tax=Stephania cephalantha TaxID=152367 RepID=A0AAP0KUU4_9MAGN
MRGEREGGKGERESSENRRREMREREEERERSTAELGARSSKSTGRATSARALSEAADDQLRRARTNRVVHRRSSSATTNRGDRRGAIARRMGWTGCRCARASEEEAGAQRRVVADEWRGSGTVARTNDGGGCVDDDAARREVARTVTEDNSEEKRLRQPTPAKQAMRRAGSGSAREKGSDRSDKRASVAMRVVVGSGRSRPSSRMRRQPQQRSGARRVQQSSRRQAARQRSAQARSGSAAAAGRQRRAAHASGAGGAAVCDVGHRIDGDFDEIATTRWRVRDPVECTYRDSDLVMHGDKDMDMFHLDRDVNVSVWAYGHQCKELRDIHAIATSGPTIIHRNPIKGTSWVEAHSIRDINGQSKILIYILADLQRIYMVCSLLGGLGGTQLVTEEPSLSRRSPALQREDERRERGRKRGERELGESEKRYEREGRGERERSTAELRRAQQKSPASERSRRALRRSRGRSAATRGRRIGWCIGGAPVRREPGDRRGSDRRRIGVDGRCG